MRRRLAALFIPILALSMMPAAAVASPADEARAQHEAVVAFWTPERMKAAIPREIKFDSVRGYIPNAPGGNKGKPAPDEGSGEAESLSTALVTGARWTQGGAIRAATGKVFFQSGAFLYQCSGSVATDTRPGHSVILTAAHCVMDKGKFVTNWMFIPDYEASPTRTCANTRYGCWTAQALFVHREFQKQKSFNTTSTLYDFAFAIVGNGGTTSGQLESVVGHFGIRFSNLSSSHTLAASLAAGDTLAAFGYPAGSPYNGNWLIYCQGPIGEDPNTSNRTWSMACDMTGGSSGGPWVTPDDPTKTAGTTLRSLNSYGYRGVANMYGPKFNDAALRVWNAANDTTKTTNTIVP
jgi:V8-like Glu-specific endopeptidase